MQKRDFLIKYVQVIRELYFKESKLDAVMPGLTEAMLDIYNDYMCWAESSIYDHLNSSDVATDYFFDAATSNSVDAPEVIVDKAIKLSLN